MHKTLTSDGVWREGRASPELLPERLRRLPSDYVTKEVADADRVHPLDEDYIVDDLVRGLARQEQGLSEAIDEPLGVAKETRDFRLTQDRIDEVRLRVMRAWAQTNIKWLANDKKPDLKAKHLWFPRDDINEYQLRTGNAPPNFDRPRHLRGFDLFIDIWSLKLPGTIESRLETARIRSELMGKMRPGLLP